MEFILFITLGSFIEPPCEENVTTAIKRLENVGALDKDDNLTPLGHHLAALPVDVRIGKHFWDSLTDLQRSNF